MNIKYLRSKLKKLGPYKIKHTRVGYWVDGAYGYSVSSYHDTEEEAILSAIKEIEQAKGNQDDDKPSWLLTDTRVS